MTKNYASENKSIDIPLLRIIAGYSIILFILLILISVFVVIPKINTLFEEQHNQNLDLELREEVALLQSFVENNKTIIEDLSKFPSVIGAVMLSDGKSRSVNNLLDNMVIGGEKGIFILQDIEANILVQTTDFLLSNYDKDQPWIEQILTGRKAFDFKLLNQNGRDITFKMSVPVSYNGFIEGVLSGEITVSFDDIFINQLVNMNDAITLIQNDITVSTNTSQIEIARQSSTLLENLNVILTHVTDYAPAYKRKRDIEKLIFSVLLGGLSLSFLSIVILSYSGLMHRAKLSIHSTNRGKAYAIPILVVFLGFSTSIIAFLIVVSEKQAATEEYLINESKEYVEDIRESLHTYLSIFDSVDAFFKASEQVKREEFSIYVKSLLANYKSVKSIEWIPKISHAQRAEYESEAQSDGLLNYTIKEVVNNNIVVAPEREYYFPVYYVEPVIGNETALGFDLASNPFELNALVKAQGINNKIATAKTALFNEELAKAGIFIYNPSFEFIASDESIEQKKLHGFTSISLNIDSLVDEAILSKNRHLSSFIQDITDPKAPQTLYGKPMELSFFTRDEIINFAGRTWRIHTYSTIETENVSWSAWGILIGGLFFSGLIVLGLIELVRRREYVEEIVLTRTAELSESETQHRAVVDNAIDGLITADEFGVIEQFNQAAEGIFGYSADEVIGANISMLTPKYNDKNMKGFFNNNKHGSTGVRMQIEGCHKDGIDIPIDLSLSEMYLNAQSKFICIVRDNRERVAFEKEREQFIERLTDSNEELERFAFVCSHDLQEPLRMIRSFSEKLQEHIKDDLEKDEKSKKYFAFIIDGAIRAQDLITDILIYSSISHDTKQLEKVNIEKLIEVIRSNILSANKEGAGSITYDNLPQLHGNKTQLLQLFQNLINNGLKYQKAESHEPHVHVGVKDRGEYWMFTVKDNGIGMEQRHLKKIFDVFQRLHRKKVFSGTGIGLSICKKIVERHGGTIWVSSEKGVGSTFYFTLLKSKI